MQASLCSSAGVLIWLFVSGVIGLWAQNPVSGADRKFGSIHAMGGVFTILAYGAEPVLDEGVSAALEEAQRLDRLISNYRPDSEWSRVNREAASWPVKVSSESFDLIAASVRYSEESGGAFDITVGPLMKVWGFFGDSGSFPDANALRQARLAVGWQNLRLDSAAHTVRFTQLGVEIDPGGIGKGYAVDVMARTLRRYGLHSALISAASSSIYALGAPPGETGWGVAVSRSEKVWLRDESLSTSGTDGKFFVAGGHTYGHIMDPRTGYPAEGVSSVSVIAAKTIDSEAWAKPYLILGRKWTRQHKPAGFRVYLCEAPATCSWVGGKGED